MCSYLVYRSPALIGVVGAISLVINLPGASGTMHGSDGCSSWCSQGHGSSNPKGCLAGVTPQSWRSFRPAPTEVTCSGLLLLKLLAQAWSLSVCSFIPASGELAFSGLAPQISLACACSWESPWLGLKPGPTVVSGSGLLPLWLLPHICSYGGC